MIREIEDSGLTMKTSIPAVFDQLGLKLPEQHLSAFIRSVKRVAARGVHEELCNLPLSLQKTDDPVKNVAPLCYASGINIDWIQGQSGVRPDIPLTSLTYAMVWELGLVRKKLKKTYSEMASWIQDIVKCETAPSGNSVEQKLKYISKEKYRLRSNNTELSHFLVIEYASPSGGPRAREESGVGTTVRDTSGPIANKDNFPTLSELAANAVCKMVDEVLPDKLLLLQLQTDSIQDMKNELSESEKEKQVLEETHRKSLLELEKCINFNQNKLEKMKQTVGVYNSHNVYRRDRRANVVRQKLNMAQKDIGQLHDKVSELQKKLSNALKLNSKNLAKTKRLEQKDCLNCGKKDAMIEELKSKQMSLEWANVCLSDELEEQRSQNVDLKVDTSEGKAKVLNTKCGKTYTPEVRAVCMQLLSLGVAVGKVSDVIRTVIEGLTNMEIGSLPSKGTNSLFQTESLIVSQYQVGEAILKTKDATVHLDGTKKRFKELGVFRYLPVGMTHSQWELKRWSVVIQHSTFPH